MVDTVRGIMNLMQVYWQEAASVFMRMEKRAMSYRQSKLAAERYSTSEREALSEKHQEDAVESLRTLRNKLMETLAAIGICSSGGSPPGLHWSDKDGAHLHEDRVHRLTYHRRWRAYFYFLATPFIVSIFMVSGLRAHWLSHLLRWWLCTLGMFCIMVAFGAARSCCTLSMSALFARDGVKKVASEASRQVTFAALVAAVNCQAGLSKRNAFMSVFQDDDEHLSGGGGPKHRGRHLEHFEVAFFYSNTMAFTLLVVLLLRRTVMSYGQCFSSWAHLWVCPGAALIAIGLTASICSSALEVAVLLCDGFLLLALLPKRLDKWDRDSSQETLRKCSKHWDTAESEDHWRPAPRLPDPRETVDDADLLLEAAGKNMLLLASLAATVTYQAALKPPGGLHHYRAQAFFYLNATAFVASAVTIILQLCSCLCRSTRGITHSAYAGLIGDVQHAARSCSESADPAVDDEDDPSRSIKRSPREATWRVACAAPHHMTGNQSLLLTMRDGDDGEATVVHPVANGEAVPLRVQGSGSVRTDSIALDDVWYVPGLDSNLVSTGQLARQGCAVNLGPGGCRITRGDTLVGSARFTKASQFELDFLKVA